MPRGDRTGPDGLGPMTGRRAGYCAGYDVPGYANTYPGRGFRGGFGRGRGYRNWFHHTGMPGWQRAAMGMPAFGRPAYIPVEPYYPTQSLSAEQEKEALKEQAHYIKKELEEIQKRLQELEQEKD